MKGVFLSKYQEYCKTIDIQDEIFTIVQNDDDNVEDYLETFLYILQRSKHKFDPSTIRTLFLRGLIDDARNNSNLLGEGDIAKKSFDQICDLCKKFSRNQYRYCKGISNRNKKIESTDTMIIGLENKMHNMKIEIMNTVSKQIDSLKFLQKLVEEQESLSIVCQKCKRNHILREFPLDIKETNECEICEENHATEKCPSIPGLKVVLEGGQPEAESLHGMEARRNWRQVSACMALEPPL